MSIYKGTTNIGSIAVGAKTEVKNVTPSTSSQSLTPSSGYNAIERVEVDAVTAAIDANIQAGNIKKDVSILGVVGTMEPKDTSGDEFVIEYDGNDYTLQSNGNVLATVANTPFAWAKGVWLKECTVVNRAGISQYNEIFRAPKCHSIKNNAQSLGKARFIELGKLIYIYPNSLGSAPNLRNFTVGDETAIKLPFSTWTATNVIAEGQTGIDELNYNIKTYIADRVADRTNDTALTITFGASLYNVLTPATIAAFTAKNWNVASA